MSRVWCEIDAEALAWNVAQFRALVGPGVVIAPTVKGNAYGHGVELAARAFVDGKADWLCVDALDEARRIRAAGLDVPIYVTGYVSLDELACAAGLDLRLVVYNLETVARLRQLEVPMRLHLKLETGNHRQGVAGAEARAVADAIAAAPRLELEGVASHFSNIEDTTDHRYARLQLERFDFEIDALRAAGHRPAMRHISNSAASILWPERSYEMIRLGIAGYGHWPSKETMVAAHLAGHGDVELRPALTWRTRVAQVKSLPEGAYVGYGNTFMTTHPTRLAVVPVGYYDGYDRALSNVGHVLVRGRRAPIRGRVCMNIVMVDVTDVPNVAVEDEVMLIGRDGDQEITAEMLADWSRTINYEVMTRIAEHVPRRARSGGSPRPIGREVYRRRTAKP